MTISSVLGFMLMFSTAGASVCTGGACQSEPGKAASMMQVRKGNFSIDVALNQRDEEDDGHVYVSTNGLQAVTCNENVVVRRRRNADMCECRRRSGMSSTGLYECADGATALTMAPTSAPTTATTEDTWLTVGDYAKVVNADGHDWEGSTAGDQVGKIGKVVYHAWSNQPYQLKGIEREDGTLWWWYPEELERVQVTALCPEFYPICYQSENCIISSCLGGCDWKQASGSDIDPELGRRYNWIHGIDGAGTDCTGNFQAPCTCNSEGLQIHQSGNWCWLTEDHSDTTCILQNGATASEWSWAYCVSSSGAMQLDCAQACSDDAGFVDEMGYGCSAWSGYDCSRAVEDFQYLQSGEDNVIAKCPAVCGMCTQAGS